MSPEDGEDKTAKARERAVKELDAAVESRRVQKELLLAVCSAPKDKGLAQRRL